MSSEREAEIRRDERRRCAELCKEMELGYQECARIAWSYEIKAIFGKLVTEAGKAAQKIAEAE